LDATERAAAAWECFVTSDGRPRLAAPVPAAEAGGADVLAAVVMRAPSGSSGPAPLAAGVDAGTSAASASGACAGGERGVDSDVRAGAVSVLSPSAGTFAPVAGAEATAVPASDDNETGGETLSALAAISLRACA